MEDKEENKPRGVSLSPKSMVDSVADWPLHRVIDHLRKKEQDEKGDGRLSADCRMFCRTGIALFSSIVGELAGQYGVKDAVMSRWLSYHGVAIAQNDLVMGRLSKVYARIRRLALSEDNPDVADINDSLNPYSPHDLDSKTPSSFYLYGSWAVAAFTELSQVCGVYPGQVAQVFMIRSALTCDLPVLDNVVGRMRTESDRWDKWMRWRIKSLEAAIDIWGSV